MLSREQIIAAIQARLEPLYYVDSLFEGGSVAFGADDELSDIDLMCDADTDSADDVFAETETALRALAPIDYQWNIPQGNPHHGYAQRFYHLAGTPEFMFIDFLVRADGQLKRLTELEHHGVPRVYFDKSGVTAPTRLDPDKLRGELRAALDNIRGALPLHAALTRKELQRGKAADAMAMYRSGVLGSIVELSRIRYCPTRYRFGQRYLQRDVPPDVAARITKLTYVADMAQLAAHVADAERWSAELLAEIDVDSNELG